MSSETISPKGSATMRSADFNGARAIHNMEVETMNQISSFYVEHTKDKGILTDVCGLHIELDTSFKEIFNAETQTDV